MYKARHQCLLLVMICSKPVPICNRFQTIRANNGKITTFFAPVSHFDAFVREEPPNLGAHNFVTRVLEATHSEDFVILAFIVLIGLNSVTDTRTDGQTDA